MTNKHSWLLYLGWTLLETAIIGGLLTLSGCTTIPANCPTCQECPAPIICPPQQECPKPYDFEWQKKIMNECEADCRATLNCVKE